jgi:hypothetical protein
VEENLRIDRLVKYNILGLQIMYSVLMALVMWTLAAHLQPAFSGMASSAHVESCRDFLARMSKKPTHLDYMGCSYNPDLQGKPLRAIYRVPGRFAANAEDYLVQTVGLNRLKHVCCLWDSPANQFRDETGREFSITMASQETLIGQRAEWSKIESFTIIVEIYTEEI